MLPVQAHISCIPNRVLRARTKVGELRWGAGACRANQMMHFRALHRNPILLPSQCIWEWANDGYFFTLQAFVLGWGLA